MTPSLFESVDREAIQKRLTELEPDAARQWGTMTPAQMLAHCAAALELATSDQPTKQVLLGKLLAPFVRGAVLGDKPFSQNSPTDPRLRITSACDFATERERLRTVVDRFVKAGPDRLGRQLHVFFGKLSGDEWGRLMHKHVDHHLRQFGR